MKKYDPMLIYEGKGPVSLKVISVLGITIGLIGLCMMIFIVLFTATKFNPGFLFFCLLYAGLCFLVYIHCFFRRTNAFSFMMTGLNIGQAERQQSLITMISKLCLFLNGHMGEDLTGIILLSLLREGIRLPLYAGN